MKNNIIQYLSLTRKKGLPKIIERLFLKGTSIILDFEDSSKNIFDEKKTDNLKDKCRDTFDFLSKQKFNNKCNFFVRVNDENTKYYIEDIKSIKKGIDQNINIKGIFLPKTENFDVVDNLNCKLDLQKKNIFVIPIIETKKGINNLKKILLDDKKKLIQGIHYGHFDYSLEANSWPFSEPYQLEYWVNPKIILETIKKFNISYYHTPFPLINNSEIFWSSLLYLENLYNDQKIYMTIINYDKRFVERPKKIKTLKLKKMSKNKKYNINLANKIISEFIETNKSNKSFSISKKRFIPPHQYLVAKDFIKNEKN